MKKVLLLVLFVTVLKILHSQTPTWQWINQAGGDGSDKAYSMCTDTDGNSYLTGCFSNSAVFGSYQLNSSGDEDIFIAKMDSSGNWIWAQSAGGEDFDKGYAIKLDTYGNVYITGYYDTSASFGTFNLINSEGTTVFVAKLDSEGNWLWAEHAACDLISIGYGICTDTFGNIYIAGDFRGSANFGSFTVTNDNESGYEIFIAKIDSEGNWLWAEQADGETHESCNSICLDTNGNVYVIGYFLGNTVSFGSVTITNTDSDYRDIFVAKINSEGNWLWAKNAGGTGNDQGYGLASDIEGNIYLTGIYRNANFGNLFLEGNDDLFISKLDSDGNWIWAKSANGIGYIKGYAIVTDSNGNIYAVGYYRNTAYFGSYTLLNSSTNNYVYDIFCSKMDANNGNWLWARNAGGSNNDQGYAISLDTTGSIYISGYFMDNASFGNVDLISNGQEDIFLAKIIENFAPNPLECISPPDNASNISVTPTLSWLCVDPEGDSLTYDVRLGTSNNPPVLVIDQTPITFNPGTLAYETSYYWQIVARDSFGNETESELWNFITESGLGINELILVNPELINNYPNPFNPETKISYTLNKKAVVDITIYNVKGQKINTIVNEFKQAGHHSSIWKGDNDLGNPVCSGIYFYRLNVNRKTESVRKCLLLK